MDIIFLAVMAYISTNIDDIFITTLLYTQAVSKRHKAHITAGRYLGTFALLTVSLLGAKGLETAIGGYTRLLGIVPLVLGLKSAYRQLKGDAESDSRPQLTGNMVTATTLLTIASGGDNIGVYVPLLSGMAGGQIVVFALVFAVMTALWSLFSVKLADAPALQKLLDKYSSIMVPAVYILLGLYILFI